MEAGWGPTPHLLLGDGVCEGDVFWTMEEDR
jgi:hypothetical protein